MIAPSISPSSLAGSPMISQPVCLLATLVGGGGGILGVAPPSSFSGPNSTLRAISAIHLFSLLAIGFSRGLTNYFFILYHFVLYYFIFMLPFPQRRCPRWQYSLVIRLANWACVYFPATNQKTKQGEGREQEATSSPVFSMLCCLIQSVPNHEFEFLRTHRVGLLSEGVNPSLHIHLHTQSVTRSRSGSEKMLLK